MEYTAVPVFSRHSPLATRHSPLATRILFATRFRPPGRLMAATIPVDDATPTSVQHGVEALRDVAALFYQFGWSRGTSSNYSIVLGRQPFRLLLTASGKDKRRLKPTDFVVVDEKGKPVAATGE